MYMRKANNRRSANYAYELTLVTALRRRLEEGDGWTRLTMKSDGQEIDIDLCHGGKYHVTFPPYYGDRDMGHGAMPYRVLDKWFDGLDEVAVFIMNDGWKQRW